MSGSFNSACMIAQATSAWLSALYAAMHVEGVQRVSLIKPSADVVLDKTQAAYCTGYTLTVGGSDE